MDIRINEKYDGRALLSYLKFTLRISSACITRLKKQPLGLTVNGEHVTVRHILHTGDLLHVGIEDEEQVNESILPVPLKLDVIYEDDNLLVINKPAFMPTHPSHNHHSDTLANGDAHLYRERNIPFVFRPVGRLDRNTSGIVVLGKNMAAAAQFATARERGDVKKTYIAILEGEMDGESGVIDFPLKRDSDSVIIRTVCSPDDSGAMNAVTLWERLYCGHGITLVRAYPKTGRTHQLRVHFASVGHPILGDDMYGRESQYICRHALHAYSLSLVLPFSGEEKTLRAELPSDMENAFSEITGKTIGSYVK